MAKALVINEYKSAISRVRWIWVIGFVTPKNVKAKKQRKNPVKKNAKDPSKERTVLTQGIFIFLLQYFLPIIDASVSEIIINKIPAIGKYICFGAKITKIVINIVIDKQ